MDKPQIIEHVNKSINYTLFGGKWIPCSAKVVVFGQHARSTGALEIYELSQGHLKEVTKIEKPSAFKCATFGASSLQSRNLATGTFDGHLQVWDLERLDLPIFSEKRHSQMINAIDGAGGLGMSGAREIVTGGRDGAVFVWDTRVKDPVAEMSTDEADAARDCWTVAFGNSYDEERCVAAGYDNGDVKLFDLRTMSLRWEDHLKNGVCSLQFDRKDIAMNKLVATCLESTIQVFDMRTQHKKEGFASHTEKAHKSTIWCGAHLPQNRDVFMTCGGNGSLNLWKYHYPAERAVKGADDLAIGVAGTVELLQNVTLSSQPIHSLDWHVDKPGLLVATGFDQTFRICYVPRTNTL